MLGQSQRSTLISGLLHALAIGVVLLLTAIKPTIPPHERPLDTKVYVPRQYHVTSNAGGGGGQHSPTPVTKGTPPPRAPMMIVPPIIRANMEMPQLPVAPTLLGLAERPVANYQIGIPLGAAGAPSGGPGGPAGLGKGSGHDVGDNPGPGSGIGDKPGISGQQRPKKVTMPELLTKKEPEYTEDARKAKLQGTVDLTIVVGADGRVERVDVIRGLGLGLDDRAVEAVKQWRFRPATADGKPIAASAAVAVTFRLL
jgi:protein TonB